MAQLPSAPRRSLDRDEGQGGQSHDGVIKGWVPPDVGLDRDRVRGAIQGMLAPGRDSRLVLVTADVSFQAGEDLRDLNYDRALLGFGRVREAFADQLAPNERHRPHQVRRLIGTGTQRAGERPGGSGQEEDAEGYRPGPNEGPPGTGPGAWLQELPARTGEGAGGRCGSRTTTGTGNVGNLLAAP